MFKVSRLPHIVIEALLFMTLISAFLLTIPAAKASNDVVDEITITVPVSCSMSSSLTSDHTAEINNGQTTNEIGTTNITTFCNDNSGYAIYAIGYTDDTYGKTVLTSPAVGSTHDIVTSTTVTTGTSSWAMKLAAVSGTYTPIIAGSTLDTLKEQGDPDFSSYQSVPEGYTKVAYYPVATDVGSLATGSSFTTTYRAHISPTQPAGTYVGQVKYTLVHPNGGFPFPEDTLVGTTLRFNEHIDVESLLPLFGGSWNYNDLHFAVKVTASDILNYLGVQASSATTWSQLIEMLPDMLASFGATDIYSDMQILDEHQSYSYLNYTGFLPWYGDSYSDNQIRYFLYYKLENYNDDASWSYLPASTGVVSYTIDGESYTFNNFNELIASISGAWLGENYFENNWGEEFFRTITIYGGEDATNQALIQWIKDNSIVLYIDTPTTDEWAFNEIVLSESSMYWDVEGSIYSNSYAAYHFDYIVADIAYGVPYWTFYYHNVTEPYAVGDGFIYLPEGANIPEYNINYAAGWGFGNINNPAQFEHVSPPTITLEGGEDLYNPAFTTWLHQNANAN